MNTPISEEVRRQLLELIDKGDEAVVRAFVISHLKEFPQETQDALIADLALEALAKKQEGDAVIAAFRTDGLASIQVLEKAKHDLDVASKAAELKQ